MQKPLIIAPYAPSAAEIATAWTGQQLAIKTPRPQSVRALLGVSKQSKQVKE